MSRTVAATAALAILAAPAARAHHTTFQGTCYSPWNGTVNSTMPAWRRSAARAYAYVGRFEGYQWGGGCWDDDQRDDSPGDPPQNATTRGEGPDCSGFTFKAWALNGRDAGYQHWDAMTNVHGPYTAASYAGGAGPFDVICKSYVCTDVMDAFASSTHVGMIYAEGTSNNQDQVIEAKCEACGTGIWTRTYRGNTSYRAVRRRAWTAEPTGPVNRIVGMAARPQGDGYWLAGNDGGVFAFGGAPFLGSCPGIGLVVDDVVGIAPAPQGDGYWLVGADGGVYTFGSASFHGSMGGQPLNAPVVGMAVAPGGAGYWLAGADGGVFAFGSAGYFGSMGGQPLNAPVVGMAATPSGSGYWLAGGDGGVFAFGAAGFHGSMSGQPLNVAMVGIAATADGGGYWLAGADGGLFAFGNAQFQGSYAGWPLNRPMRGLCAYPGGSGRDGYWMVAEDGGVFTFGTAPFFGSMPR